MKTRIAATHDKVATKSGAMSLDDAVTSGLLVPTIQKNQSRFSGGKAVKDPNVYFATEDGTLSTAGFRISAGDYRYFIEKARRSAIVDAAAAIAASPPAKIDALRDVKDVWPLFREGTILELVAIRRDSGMVVGSRVVVVDPGVTRASGQRINGPTDNLGVGSFGWTRYKLSELRIDDVDAFSFVRDGQVIATWRFVHVPVLGEAVSA